MAITAYTSSCADKKRLGGVQAIWVADEADVDEADYTISGGNITAISSLTSFKRITGDDFFAQWTSTDEKQDGNNMLLTNTLVAELPNLTKTQRDLHVELRNTCGLKILVKMFGDTGTATRTVLLGHEDYLSMKVQTVEGDSGRQLEDAKMLTFTFVGKATLPAYYYTGADPS